MSNSNGCKIAITAVIVAIIMGSLGFVTGYLTHAVLFANEASPTPQTIVREVVVTATPMPGEELVPPVAQASPTEPPTPVPPTLTAAPTSEPTPAPTIVIPPAQGTTFDLFWEAWALIQRDYYGTLPSEEELTYGAIRGALNTLNDPFTGFIEPSVAEINRQDDSGSFEGIGAYVTMEDGWLKIVSTFKDQPAEQAGLRSGDIVLKVDDTEIVNMSIYEAISLIRGPAGSQVRLTIAREGQDPFEVEITRASIEIPIVESEMRDDGIGYLQLYDFSTDASVKLADAIEELESQGATGLVLDLRGNPGGWLNEAILVSGLFLPKDDVVVIERYKDAAPQVLRTPNDPVAPDIPLVVLVNGGSASASEIVAGALQDYGRAVLVGEQTFGKGSVQWPHELSNGAELRVTVAHWFTPNDRAIHGEGLAPDIVVALTEEDVAAGIDPQLDRAVEYLLNGQ
jgi:carboxyl-terminal processing protease